MAIGGHYEGTWWRFDDTGMTRDDLFDILGHTKKANLYYGQDQQLRINAQGATLTDEERERVRRSLAEVMLHFRLLWGAVILSAEDAITVGWREAVTYCPHEFTRTVTCAVGNVQSVVPSDTCRLCGESRELLAKWAQEE